MGSGYWEMGGAVITTEQLLLSHLTEKKKKRRGKAPLWSLPLLNKYRT